eukprot:gene1306-4740_t
MVAWNKPENHCQAGNMPVRVAFHAARHFCITTYGVDRVPPDWKEMLDKYAAFAVQEVRGDEDAAHKSPDWVKEPSAKNKTGAEVLEKKLQEAIRTRIRMLRRIAGRKLFVPGSAPLINKLSKEATFL